MKSWRKYVIDEEELKSQDFLQKKNRANWAKV